MTIDLANIDAYKLAQLRYGVKKPHTFPGPQLTNMNDFNNLCFNTVAEFVDPNITPLQNSPAGQKCQIAMIQQLGLNGQEHPGLKLRMPVVLSRPQYFKNAYLATGNPNSAYKIAVNSCITNLSPGLEQASCIQRCGNARDALILSLQRQQHKPVSVAIPIVSVDHTRASVDHARASVDHARASVDHARASVDMRASVDHARDSVDMRASVDHTRASVDHTRASVDHARDSVDHARDSVDMRDSVDHARESVDHARESYEPNDLLTVNDCVSTVKCNEDSNKSQGTLTQDAVSNMYEHAKSQEKAENIQAYETYRDSSDRNYQKIENSQCGGIIFIIIIGVVIFMLITSLTNAKDTESFDTKTTPAKQLRKAPIKL